MVKMQCLDHQKPALKQFHIQSSATYRLIGTIRHQGAIKLIGSFTKTPTIANNVPMRVQRSYLRNPLESSFLIATGTFT